MVVSLSRFLVVSPSATPGGILSHQKINCQHPDAKKNLAAVDQGMQQPKKPELCHRARMAQQAGPAVRVRWWFSWWSG
jgi:hypothetical protein